ncbi:MAG: hypothetical protein R6U27_02535 [Desulfobacterales bacterium]
MNQKKEHSVSSEVKDRLQKLFMEDNGTDDDYLFQDVGNPVDSEIKELKAVVLSIEWEINDEIMASLIKQIEALKKVYQEDHILILFLQLLGTVGKYIQAKKASAHPDSIKLLNSTYQSFETAVTNKQLSHSDRKKLLQVEINRFKALKDRINYESKSRVDGIQGEVHRTEKRREKNRIGAENSQISQELAIAIEEIKKIIQAEFQSLKAELKNWIEDKP